MLYFVSYLEFCLFYFNRFKNSSVKIMSKKTCYNSLKKGTVEIYHYINIILLNLPAPNKITFRKCQTVTIHLIHIKKIQIISCYFNKVCVLLKWYYYFILYFYNLKKNILYCILSHFS